MSTASDIVKGLGGRDNITDLEPCITRLRVEVVDQEKVDEEALRAAGAALGDSHLDGCTLVVTLEPCTMCAGAIVLARVARLIRGAWEPRTGACGSVRDVVRDARANHQVEVRAGLRAQESQALLTAFFADRR